MSITANKWIMLNNIIFVKKNFRRAKTLDHPRASIKITKYGTNKFVMVSALADTGEQSSLWGWKSFQDAGFSMNDLIAVSSTIRTAKKIPIKILGAFRATVSGISPRNGVISCIGFIHDSVSVTWIFLSYKTMVELLIINRDFSTIGSQLPHQHYKVVANLNEKKISLNKFTSVFISGLSSRQKSLTWSASSRNSARSVTSILSRGTGLWNLKMPETRTMQSMRWITNHYVVGEPLLSMSREFPSQKTFTMTRGMTNTGAAEAFMSAEEKATAVMTAAASMTGTGINTVRL